MQLDRAVTAYFYSLDLTSTSEADYRAKVRRFVTWLKEHTCEFHPQPVDEIEHVDTTHMREYVDWLKGRTFETKKNLRTAAKPMGSHTLHAYARVMKAFLNWGLRIDSQSLRTSAHGR